ncbi:hypothetical protein CRM22_011121 [Opisthorchis felineus]|uniref:Uncharacterized protein n=1 Tax=Opisthorchis felineus TaxID=147828 RepID=A0A4S2KBY2_OPIFE|nr:hypothetical protein CRM22_011121 [Opisthorchis felineus]
MEPDKNLKCTCRCTCRSSRSSKPSGTSDTVMESIVNQTNPAATESVQLKEKHRLITHLEQQSHQINSELKRLQLEGFLTNAAIQAMRKQASNQAIERSVHHQLGVPHSNKQPEDDCILPVVCSQNDQNLSATHQAGSDPSTTNTNNASRRGCSTKCCATEHQDHIRQDSHSGQAGYSNVNQELTELRSRQTLLAERIQSLHHARSQLMTNLNQLLQLEESADSSKLLKANKPHKATRDGSSTNYEYLFSASRRTNRQPSSGFGDLYCDHGRPCRVLLPRIGVDNSKQPERESSFRLNDQECQTDFPLKAHHNAVYEHISDSDVRINDCATEDNSPRLPNKAPIKPLFDLGVQSTTVSALAAVAAVAAASFLSKTMNQVHGVTEVPNFRGSSDQSQSQSADKQERRQGAETCTPVLKRILVSDKAAGKVNPVDCLTQSSQSNAQPLPTFVVQDEPKSVSLSLDHTIEPKGLRRETFENKASTTYQNSQVPHGEKGIDDGTPSSVGLCCGFQFPYGEEIHPSMPENTIFGKKDGSLSEFESSTRVCSRFSERIQLARNYVDRLYGPSATKHLIEETAHHIRPTSRRCSPEAVADSFYDAREIYADVLDNCCDLPQCQRRFEYISKPENSACRNPAIDKILTESTQVPSTSTNKLKPTPIQIVKPALRSINAADSSGFDTGSPSDSDDLSAKSAQILSRARTDTYRNMHNFATDSAQTEQKEKGKKPKGVLVSESSKERRQRELQKNNCPQRTVVWEDELYNGSYQKCKEENSDSTTGNKVNNTPTFNLIDCEQWGSSSASHMNVSLTEEDFNRRPGMFPPGRCEDTSADPRAGHGDCVEGQVNCEMTNNRVIRRGLPVPGKTPAVKNR